MFPVNAAGGQIAVLAIAVAVLIGFLAWSVRARSYVFFLGALAGTGLSMVGLHDHLTAKSAAVRAFALFPTTDPAGQIAVLAVAVAVLVGFLLWSARTRSQPFFLGVLAGTGLVLSFDIVWVHWLFGLITNTQMDVVLEPFFVATGIAFMWFGVAQEGGSTPAT